MSHHCSPCANSQIIVCAKCQPSSSAWGSTPPPRPGQQPRHPLGLPRGPLCSPWRQPAARGYPAEAAADGSAEGRSCPPGQRTIMLVRACAERCSVGTAEAMDDWWLPESLRASCCQHRGRRRAGPLCRRSRCSNVLPPALCIWAAALPALPGTPEWLAVTHCASLWLAVSHCGHDCGSLYLTVPRCDSLCLIVAHCGSLWLIVARCDSLCLAESHCASLCLAVSHCGSTHCVSLCLTVSRLTHLGASSTVHTGSDAP